MRFSYLSDIIPILEIHTAILAHVMHRDLVLYPQPLAFLPGAVLDVGIAAVTVEVLLLHMPLQIARIEIVGTAIRTDMMIGGVRNVTALRRWAHEQPLASPAVLRVVDYGVSTVLMGGVLGGEGSLAGNAGPFVCVCVVVDLVWYWHVGSVDFECPG